MAQIWTAFLDLLGTRQRALLPGGKLGQALRDFHIQVRRLANSSERENNTYAFSDSVFVEIHDLKKFLTSLQCFRSDLFVQGIFFKCAIVPGRLGAISIGSTSRHADRGGLHGFSFSDIAVKAYELHEDFHGVGVTICTEDVNISSSLAPLIIQSNYVLPSERRGQTTQFRGYCDLVYPTRDIGTILDRARMREEDSDEIPGGPPTMQDGEAFLELLAREMFKARMISPRAAASYVAAFIAIVESSDFSKLKWDKGNACWSKYPPIFQLVVINDSLRRCTDIPGVSAIFLRILQKVLKHHRSETDLVDLVILRVMSEKVVESSLKLGTRDILDPGNREFVLGRWSEIAIRKRRRRVT